MMDRFYASVEDLIAQSNEEGRQTFVKYALVLSVIVVGVLLATTLTGLTTAITGAMNTVAGAF